MIKKYSLHHKNLFWFFLMFFLFTNLFTLSAQESAVTVGGNGSGSDGTVSYSVGQVFYTSAVNSNGGVYQGVQQPFVISVDLGIEHPEIDLSFLAYPNPTTDFLMLKIPENLKENLNYQLYDFSGKAIASNLITENLTRIEMGYLPSAVYYLQILERNKTIKKFKIIKN